MSSSITREHLRIMLQRTAIMNDELKKRNSKTIDKEKQISDTNLKNSIDRSKNKKTNKNRAISDIENSFMDAVSLHKGSRSELQRQLKKAKVIVDAVVVKDKVSMEKEKKRQMKKANLNILTRTSKVKDETSKITKKYTEKNIIPNLRKKKNTYEKYESQKYDPEADGF